MSLSGLVLHGKRLPQLYSAHHRTHSRAVALPRSIATNHLQQHYWDLLPWPKQFTFPSASIAGNSTIDGPQTAASITGAYLSGCDERRSRGRYIKEQRTWLPADARASALLTYVRVGGISSGETQGVVRSSDCSANFYPLEIV